MTEQNQPETTSNEQSGATAPPEQRPDHVDFNDLGLEPAKLQILEGRWKSVYGRMKDFERAVKQAGEDNKALFDRVQELSRSDQERTSDRIKADIKAAAEAGEFDKLATLTEELVKATSTAKAPTPGKVEVKPSESKPEESAPDIAEHLTVEQQAALQAWAHEKDEQDQYRRPWLQPEHPQNKRAMRLIKSIAEDDTMSFKDKMAEVDRLMGIPEKTRQPSSVLTPSLVGNRGAPGKTPALRPEQKAMAEAMGVKPEAYAAVLAKSPKKANGEMIMSYAVE